MVKLTILSCATLIPHFALKDKNQEERENKKDEVEKRVRGKNIDILNGILHPRKKTRRR